MSKFIVITSINNPTQAVKNFNKIEGWQTLVVADLKTPLDWQIEGAKILTVEDQKTSPLKMATMLDDYLRDTILVLAFYPIFLWLHLLSNLL